MNSHMLLIISMMFVTYIPRLLPFILILEKKLPSRLVKFLQFIPYTALWAMIIPGLFSAIPEMPQAGILGISFSFIYAWYKGGIIIPVLGSILVAFLMLLMKNGFVL